MYNRNIDCDNFVYLFLQMCVQHRSVYACICFVYLCRLSQFLTISKISSVLNMFPNKCYRLIFRVNKINVTIHVSYAVLLRHMHIQDNRLLRKVHPTKYLVQQPNVTPPRPLNFHSDRLREPECCLLELLLLSLVESLEWCL